MTLPPIHCRKCGKPFEWADENVSDAVRKGGTTNGLCRACRHLYWESIKEQFEKKEVN